MSSAVHPAQPGARPLTRLLIVALLLSPLTVALATLVRREAPPPPAVAMRAAPQTPPAATRPSGLPRPLLGFAINAHHISDLSLYLRSVDAVADLGANALIVVTPMYQARVDSSRIRIPRTRCPTETQLDAILRRAKERGLATILMPSVLIELPGEKDWRGVIRPDDWDAWWESYEANLDRFVAIAAANGVDLLSVGSELNSTEDELDRWVPLIARVRERFDGAITYSANWDRYHRVTIWPHVDVMSVSSYFELERDRPGAPEADLVEAWAPVRGALLDAARRWQRPLLLSEIGYPSLPWANAHPWNYVAEDDEEADHEAQARSWRAFFGAWTETIADPESAVLGFCGYRWDPYHDGDRRDTGYGIVGKPAQEIVRRGFAAIRAAGK